MWFIFTQYHSNDQNKDIDINNINNSQTRNNVLVVRTLHPVVKITYFVYN